MYWRLIPEPESVLGADVVSILLLRVREVFLLVLREVGKVIELRLVEKGVGPSHPLADPQLAIC